jgi:hypothetical protein
MAPSNSANTRIRRLGWMGGALVMIVILAAIALAASPGSDTTEGRATSGAPTDDDIATYDLAAPVGDGDGCAQHLLQPVLDALEEEDRSFEPTEISDAIASYCRQSPSTETIRQGVRWVLACLSIGIDGVIKLQD